MTAPCHLSPKHRAIAEWTPEKFILKAVASHEDVEHYIRKVLERKRYVDQAHKCCSGILNFARKVGGTRLAAACFLADSYGKYNFVEIQEILKNNTEQFELSEETADILEHENIRGRIIINNQSGSRDCLQVMLRKEVKRYLVKTTE